MDILNLAKHGNNSDIGEKSLRLILCMQLTAAFISRINLGLIDRNNNDFCVELEFYIL